MKIRDGELMTCSDAAKVLGVGRELVRKLATQGRLPSVRTAGNTRLMWARDVAALAKARARAMKERGNVRGVSL